MVLPLVFVYRCFSYGFKDRVESKCQYARPHCCYYLVLTGDPGLQMSKFLCKVSIWSQSDGKSMFTAWACVTSQQPEPLSPTHLTRITSQLVFIHLLSFPSPSLISPWLMLSLWHPLTPRCPPCLQVARLTFSRQCRAILLSVTLSFSPLIYPNLFTSSTPWAYGQLCSVNPQ